MKCTCEEIKELDDRDGCPVHDVEPVVSFDYHGSMSNTCAYCGQAGHDRLTCPNRDPGSFL